LGACAFQLLSTWRRKGRSSRAFGYELGEIFDNIFEKGEISDHKGDPRREKISLAEAYVRGLVEWNPVRMFIEACEKGIVTPTG